MEVDSRGTESGLVNDEGSGGAVAADQAGM
jgi:hypothetical protein